MKSGELIERLNVTIIDFVKDRKKLLRQDAHEDSYTDEFIAYLRKHFSDWPYDINHNYNKRVVNNAFVKKQTYFVLAALPPNKVPQDANIEDEKVLKGLLPDIIFHDLESSAHNFLIFEIKKTTNKDAADREMDLLKLSTTTAVDLKYQYGVFVDFSSGDEFNEASPALFKVFHNGEIIHEQIVQMPEPPNP